MKFFRWGGEDEFAETDRPRPKKPNVLVTLIIDALAVVALLSILVYVTKSKREGEVARSTSQQETEAVVKRPAPAENKMEAVLPAEKTSEKTAPAGQAAIKKDQPAQAPDKSAPPPPEKNQTAPEPQPKETGPAAHPAPDTAKGLSFTDNEMELSRHKAEQTAQSRSPKAGEPARSGAPAKETGPSPIVAPERKVSLPDPAPAAPPAPKPSRQEPPAPPPMAPAPSAPSPEKSAAVQPPVVERKSLVILSSKPVQSVAEGTKEKPPEPEKKSVVLFSARGAGMPSVSGDAAVPPQPSPEPREKPAGETGKQIVILSGKSIPTAPAKPEPAPETALLEKAQEPAEEKPAPESGGKSPHKGGYRLRFGLCQMRESCELIKTNLAKAGIAASVEKTSQEFNTYYSMLGPWQTATHSKQAMADLAKHEIKTTVLTADGKYYLVTEPELSEKAAKETLGKVQRMGIMGKTLGKKESLPVFKVYGESFDKRNTARQREDYYRKKGFDCAVEE